MHSFHTYKRRLPKPMKHRSHNSQSRRDYLKEPTHVQVVMLTQNSYFNVNGSHTWKVLIAWSVGKSTKMLLCITKLLWWHTNLPFETSLQQHRAQQKAVTNLTAVLTANLYASQISSLAAIRWALMPSPPHPDSWLERHDNSVHQFTCSLNWVFSPWVSGSHLLI